MTPVEIRDAREADFAVIIRLNADEEQHTSDMNRAKLRTLHSISAFHKVACVDQEVVAFLLAMRSGAAYINDNFAWFTQRYDAFLYVDRIVVASTMAGRGIGSQLYNALFASARALQVPLITCEYNIEPPNLPSRRFHERFGFREAGTQWVANQTKRVSMQLAEVCSHSSVKA